MQLLSKVFIILSTFLLTIFFNVGSISGMSLNNLNLDISETFIGTTQLSKISNTSYTSGKSTMHSNFANNVKSDFYGESMLSVEITEEYQKRLNNLTSTTETIKKQVDSEKELTRKAEKLVRYLKAQGSPVATMNYAKQIIEVSEANGADYKIIVGIMGVESGFCAANYLVYNCFGYLNGARYGSFENAFNDLIPRISREYANVYGTNFLALTKAYGVVEYEYHSERLSRYYYGLASL